MMAWQVVRKIFRTILMRIRLSIASIRNPTLIVRLTDNDGKKKIVVISRSIFGAKAVAKFEILREFSTDSCEPGWEEVDFKSFDYQSKKVVVEPPTTTYD